MVGSQQETEHLRETVQRQNMVEAVTTRWWWLESLFRFDNGWWVHKIVSKKKVRRTTTRVRLCRFISWQECQTGHKQEARSPRVAQDIETNSGVQGLETGCRFSSIYWPPCKLLFKSAVVQIKKPVQPNQAKTGSRKLIRFSWICNAPAICDQIGATETK